eukprot:m.254735 g.254735  ORF g.254735 m.254735 type:complete len:72 (+) comp15494_c1_seq55:1796-2011(+)
MNSSEVPQQGELHPGHQFRCYKDYTQPVLVQNRTIAQTHKQCQQQKQRPKEWKAKANAMAKAEVQLNGEDG